MSRLRYAGRTKRYRRLMIRDLVYEATSEELIEPSNRDLDHLWHWIVFPYDKVKLLADLLLDRTKYSNWVVVCKALIISHHFMVHSNDKFIKYLVSTLKPEPTSEESKSTFGLKLFNDEHNLGGSRMSCFVRRYADYLDNKVMCYRTVGIDFCKLNLGIKNSSLRTMTIEELWKTLPVLQEQLDVLLNFDYSPEDWMNDVIDLIFLLLFRDMIRLLTCYNDGICNLLEKFCEMDNKQCKEALNFYKKYLASMDLVAKFLEVANDLGIDESDFPDLTIAPTSSLEALEAHLKILWNKNLAKIVGAMKPKTHDQDADQSDEFLECLWSEEELVTTSPQPHQSILAMSESDVDGSASDSAHSPYGSSDELLQLAVNPPAKDTNAVAPIPVVPTQLMASSFAMGLGEGVQFEKDNSLVNVLSNPTYDSNNASAISFSVPTASDETSYL